MKYRSLGFVVVLTAAFFIAIDSSQFLQRNFMALGNIVKLFILDIKDDITLYWDKYINQAQAIENYEKKLKDYERIELELQNVHNELNALSLFDTQRTFYQDSNFLPARAYSYVGMGDYNKVWIDFNVDNYDEGRLFGIVQDGKALGIAVVRQQRLIGFLNGEQNASYSVFIGDEKIPGIIRPSQSYQSKILADFIPAWKRINIGDQVFTSGLDSIFIEGILVGEVVSISNDYGYITAEVKPYSHNFGMGYVWLVDTKKDKQIEPLERVF